RSSLVRVAPQITAARMVRDYVTELYLPASRAAAAFHADASLAESFTAWKAQISSSWPRVAVDDVSLHGGDGAIVSTGAEVTLTAAVELADLRGQDCLGEAVLGPVGEDGELIEPQLIRLQRAGDGLWAARCALTVPGEVGYTVRVTPQHPVLGSRA